MFITNSKTKIYEGKSISSNTLKEVKVKKELERIADIQLSAMTNVRVPICITLDLSGSMGKYTKQIKEVFTLMTRKLKVIGGRDFSLIVMVINNNVAKPAYFGELTDFNCEEFISTLPAPHGQTPLANALNSADDILCELERVLEENKHWYTVPMFFSITDCGENGSADDLRKAKQKYSEDIIEGKKLLVEFVTGNNPNGLNLGGYKVSIDDKSDDFEKIKKRVTLFMEALATATSSDVKINDVNGFNRPLKSNREEYNKYMSNILLYNFQLCYERTKNA